MDLIAVADPDRFAECCDEIVSNATHWLDKDPKRIWVTASIAAAADLPQEIDSSRAYALIHFRDNGPGVPLDCKERIFDAFFTTRDHGAGLGLAVCRRIIEGLGGLIREVGRPGEGADFEIYLPLATPAPDSSVDAKGPAETVGIAISIGSSFRASWSMLIPLCSVAMTKSVHCEREESGPIRCI